MEFPNTWFEDRTKPLWEKYVKDLEINSYLEIGVCFGASMRWVLENLQPQTAVGVDPWRDPKNKNHETFKEYKRLCYENLAPWLETETLTLHQQKSLDYFCSHIGTGEKFDLIYIDGDHGGYEAMLDMMMAYRMLASKTGEMEIQTVSSKGKLHPMSETGGIMIVDDLQRVWHFGKPLVGIAVHQFELLMHGKMHRLWKDGRQAAFIRVD